MPNANTIQTQMSAGKLFQILTTQCWQLLATIQRHTIVRTAPFSTSANTAPDCQNDMHVFFRHQWNKLDVRWLLIVLYH